MRKIKFNQALAEAHVAAMVRDASVFIIGEAVDTPAGIFGTTRPAFLRFGKKRVLGIPLSENAITGMCLGASIEGLRPVLVHQRNEFAMLSMDQIVNHISKWSYLHQGKARVSMVIRVLIGRGWGQGAQHSQSLQALFAHIPGLKVVMPSTPHTAKGLFLASVFDGAPVIFIEHRWLFDKEGNVPEKFYTIPLGKAMIHRRGKDVTIVATSLMVYEALTAAVELHAERIEAEVVDPLTLRPLDEETILASVRKTGRLIIADTSCRRFGASAEISAVASERAFNALKGPIVRIGLPDAPTPVSAELEKHYYPSAKEIVAAARYLLSGKAGGAASLRKGRTQQEEVVFTGPF